MERGGSWLQTFTGKAFWPLDPRPEEVLMGAPFYSQSLQVLREKPEGWLFGGWFHGLHPWWLGGPLLGVPFSWLRNGSM